jgi:hypothetical protein
MELILEYRYDVTHIRCSFRSIDIQIDFESFYQFLITYYE